MAQASVEDRVLEVLKEKSLIMSEGTSGIGDLVPLMAMAEARYYVKHDINPGMPKPLMWTLAVWWDGLKMAAYSGISLGIYTAVEKLQQLFK